MIVILQIQYCLCRLIDHLWPVSFKYIEQSDASHEYQSKVNGLNDCKFQLIDPILMENQIWRILSRNVNAMLHFISLFVGMCQV